MLLFHRDQTHFQRYASLLRHIFSYIQLQKAYDIRPIVAIVRQTRRKLISFIKGLRLNCQRYLSATNGIISEHRKTRAL
jgi:hypothetical protein